ncbi:MAG TPA: hypothetical protein VKL99_00745 [Candidatus Angelobacter sp.]|nr:hypothetical protein [Candidatus Angelobacter sp.]
MSRSVVIAAFFAFALQASQAQVFSHGIPASATSPEPDGRQHGVPASVVSPTQLPFGVNPPLRRNVRVQGPLRRFGNPRGHRPVFVPVPVFYSYYTDGGYPSAADPYVPDTAPADPAPAQQASGERSEDELRAAYLQGAHDALSQNDTRYGEHYMDSRERDRQQAAVSDKKKIELSKEVAAPPVEDKSPATVFIFKDGHQLETKNYAIMGQTLFDFSGKTLKKIQMDEIDSAATAKANDDRGVTVKLQ